MAIYEIRIVKPSGANSLVFACEQLTDDGAIRSVETIQRGGGDTIEIWQGMRLVHRGVDLLRAG